MSNFFERVVEFFSIVKIALSPILIFTTAGLACHYWLDGTLGAFVGIALVVIGLIVGIWFAIYVHKKHGAIEFNARLEATPELDKKAEGK